MGGRAGGGGGISRGNKMSESERALRQYAQAVGAIYMSGSGPVGQITPNQMRQAEKQLSSAKAQLTKAQNAYDKAMGGYYVAQGGENKNKAAKAVSAARDKLDKAQSRYDSIQKAFNHLRTTYINTTYPKGISIDTF